MASCDGLCGHQCLQARFLDKGMPRVGTNDGQLCHAKVTTQFGAILIQGEREDGFEVLEKVVLILEDEEGRTLMNAGTSVRIKDNPFRCRWQESDHNRFRRLDEDSSNQRVFSGTLFDVIADPFEGADVILLFMDV